MKILLIDNGTKLLTQLQDLLGHHEITRRWEDSSAYITEGYGLIVLSGSSERSVVHNQGVFSKEIDLIKTSEVPIIGICFGCELIVSACGGELAQMDHRIQGTQTIRVVDKQLPFSEIQVYESHRWVIKRLPKEFKVLAESDHGPEVIRHVTRPIYGLQFHPEKCVDELQGDDLFKSIIAKLHLA